jgi:hypothetical protein
VTPSEAVAVLAYVSAIDPRVRRSDSGELRLLERAWSTHLADIDTADAIAAVDAHYARPGAAMAMPGDVAGRVHAQRVGQRRDALERTGAEREAAALDAADADNIPAYLATLRHARGVPGARRPRQARAAIGASSDDVDALCRVWVQTWRSTRPSTPLPPLAYAQHLGLDATRLVHSDPDPARRVAAVTEAARHGRCPCGEQATP